MAAKRTRRGTIWSNLRWIHPVRSGYGTGVKSLREKLKYFQFRDDRDTRAPQGGRRWIDHGLGSTHREILQSCEVLSSDDRLAWTMMLSPKPRLMLLIESEADRRQLLQNLTEDVIEHWFEMRGLVEPQYSYVMHDRATSEEGLQQLHSHLILPGTVETAAGRERFDNNPGDLREFNTLVEDLFEIHLDRQLGIEGHEQWKVIQREEALKKYFTNLDSEVVPDNLADLAERLHSTGYDAEHIPNNISSVDEFNVWLTSIESDEPDLDAWIGSNER